MSFQEQGEFVSQFLQVGEECEHPLRKQEKSLHFHYGPLSLCEPAPNLPGERVAANSEDVQEKIHDCGGILPFAAQVRSMACVK